MRKKLSKRKILERQILKQLNELSWEPPTLAQQIKILLKETQKSLEYKVKEQLSGIILSVERINREIEEMRQKKDIELFGKTKEDIDGLNKTMIENQKIIDKFIAENYLNK